MNVHHFCNIMNCPIISSLHLHELFMNSLWMNYVQHGGCDRSAEDAYSFATPDPTSGVSRGPYKPDFHWIISPTWSGHWFWLQIFPCTWLDSPILTADYSVYLILTHWIWLPIFEMGLTAGVTGQQRMLTPSRHLILPSHLSKVRVALPSIL
jgi:hypothetical protein